MQKEIKIEIFYTFLCERDRSIIDFLWDLLKYNHIWHAGGSITFKRYKINIISWNIKRNEHEAPHNYTVVSHFKMNPNKVGYTIRLSVFLGK